MSEIIVISVVIAAVSLLLSVCVLLRMCLWKALYYFVCVVFLFILFLERKLLFFQ